MSGFVGIIHCDGSPVDPSVLHQMTQSMAPLGPDAQETWCEGSVGLGHAMLRTTWEAANERQPGTLRNLKIVADARVDARAELLQKLTDKSSRAHDLSLHSPDSELILHAYDVWGDSCLDHLLGDFSFAIWDQTEKRLFCARDHFGVKTLYYARAGNTFVFSNSLDTVRLYPGISAGLCDAAIADFLVFAMNLHLDLTPFEQILRIPRAHTLTLSGQEIRVKRYWTFPIEEPLRYRRSQDYIDQFRELLEIAVKDRLRCDRASISLSGGLDSPSVAAEAVKQLGSPNHLMGVTAGCEDVFPDPEPHFAQIAAEYLKIPWHFVAMDKFKPFERWGAPELCRIWPTDITMGAFHSDVIYNLGKGSRVVLTGEGGDAGLAPSLRYYRGFGVFGLALETGKYMLSHGHHPRLGFRVSWQKWRKLPHVKLPKFPQWLEPRLEVRLGLRDRWSEMMKEPASEHPHRPDSHSGLSGPWLGFFGTDESSQPNLKFEVRHPLFDVRFQRFFFRLPVLPWCADKEIFRTGMRDSLPKVILQRPKTPVRGIPIAMLLHDAAPDILSNFCASPHLHRYVVQDRIPSLKNETAAADPRIDLRPISLNYWLCRNAR